MLTERGKPDYPIPHDFGHVLDICLDQRETMGHYVMITMISAEQMAKVRAQDGGEDIWGVPTHATIIGEALWFWPTPDAAYPINARYEPALKEF